MRPSYAALLSSVLILGLSACGKDKPAAPPAAVSKPAPAAAKAATPAAAPAPKGATAPSPAPAVDPGIALAARVKAALIANKAIPAHQIDVTVKDGVVSLWGTVGDPAELDKAAATARTVAGVRSVQNNLKIVRGS